MIKKLLGYFKTYTLYINEQWASTVNVLEVFITVAHEFRHRYQHLQVEYSRTNKELLLEHEDTISIWEFEKNNYIMPIGIEVLDNLYLSQQIEIDAIAFSYFLLEMCFKEKQLIPLSIKDNVLMRAKQIKMKYEKEVAICK